MSVAPDSPGPPLLLSTPSSAGMKISQALTSTHGRGGSTGSTIVVPLTSPSVTSRRSRPRPATVPPTRPRPTPLNPTNFLSTKPGCLTTWCPRVRMVRTVCPPWNRSRSGTHASNTNLPAGCRWWAALTKAATCLRWLMTANSVLNATSTTARLRSRVTPRSAVGGCRRVGPAAGGIGWLRPARRHRQG